MTKKALTILASTALGLAVSINAHAWGTEGHQIIASIAQDNLQPEAAKEVARLLALEPGATLAEASFWSRPEIALCEAVTHASTNITFTRVVWISVRRSRCNSDCGLCHAEEAASEGQSHKFFSKPAWEKHDGTGTTY